MNIYTVEPSAFGLNSGNDVMAYIRHDFLQLLQLTIQLETANSKWIRANDVAIGAMALAMEITPHELQTALLHQVTDRYHEALRRIVTQFWSYASGVSDCPAWLMRRSDG